MEKQRQRQSEEREIEKQRQLEEYRAQEENLIRDLGCLHLVRKAIPKDGSCLFRSISEGVCEVLVY